MKTQLSHVVAAVFRRPWFIREEVLQEIAAVVQFHLEGGSLSRAEIRERLDVAAARNGPRGGAKAVGDIAVIPIYGMIAPRATMMTDMSGGCTCESIREQFRAAMADETIGSILFDVDSPGGYVDGIEELATEIRQARGTKPIVAIANYGMASAAYYLASQADEVVASPSSMVGWIGSVTWHTEFSKFDEMAGITTTVFRNPAGKFGANEFEPISEKAATDIQQEIDDYSSQFHAAVSKGRGVPLAQIKADFGQGGGMTAARAKAAGLVDRVDTFDGTIRRMAAGKIQTRGAVATRGVRIENRNAAGELLTSLQAAEDLVGPNQGGDPEPADDPGADASGEAGAPPSEVLDEIALERAIASRRRRSA
jgi:signal peptide peptidase SppA